MYLIIFAAKNLLRNKRRTALTLFSITTAVIILMLGNAYLNGMLGTIIGQSIRDNGHIIIQTKEYTKNERTLPLDAPVPDMQAVIDALTKNHAVRYASPRMSFGAVFIKGERSVKALGHAFDTDKEKNFVRLSDALVDGHYFTGGKDVMLGVELARSLNVKPGDTVSMLTRDRFGGFKGSRLTVCGVTDLGAYQLNRSFYLPLQRAWKVLDVKDKPQRIAVILTDFSQAHAVQRALLRDHAVTSRSLDVFRADEVGLFQTLFVYIIFIIRLIFGLFLAVAVVVIANTMMMTGLERTGEVGVLSAMGMKARHIALSFMFEAISLGVIGSIIGAAAALPAALYFQKNGVVLGSVARGMPIPMKSVIYPELNTETALTIIGLGILISIIAGMIPALRALRLNPASALRDGSK